MPTIFEIFSYPIGDTSAEAQQARRTGRCSFMARDCDGGGNRYSSELKLESHPELAAVLTVPAERETIAAGICSIKLTLDGPPWIVCPRRLLALSRTSLQGVDTHQSVAEGKILSLLGYPAGTTLGIWSEVKLKLHEDVDGQRKGFDYTFDYIVMPMGRITQQAAASNANETWAVLRRRLERTGYTIAQRDGGLYVEDFPISTPSIIEIMTSSTSGGNKRNRTTISAAFEDAMLGQDHKAPGINYRQVWARMVSQLIVKSEVALHWGGKTIWLLQDVLVNYICQSTALDIRRFLGEHTGEVNMLSLSFGADANDEPGVIELGVSGFYAGPMAASDGAAARASFQDMVHTPLRPHLWRLVRALTSKAPVNKIVIPNPQ